MERILCLRWNVSFHFLFLQLLHQFHSLSFLLLPSEKCISTAFHSSPAFCLLSFFSLYIFSFLFRKHFTYNAHLKLNKVRMAWEKELVRSWKEKNGKSVLMWNGIIMFVEKHASCCKSVRQQKKYFFFITHTSLYRVMRETRKIS